jgi:hypothetical protein
VWIASGDLSAIFVVGSDMEIGDLEECARTVRRIAVAVGRETPVRIAKMLGFSVQVVPNLRAAGVLAEVNGQTTIGLRRSLSNEARQHTTGHELGHWVLTREGVRAGPLTEEWCDYIGAALVAPREAFQATLCGSSYADLAREFRTTETLVALRVGELTGEPVAVIAPHAVRARGEWHQDAHGLRQLARTGGPGVRKCRLTDDPKRWALVGIGNAG